MVAPNATEPDFIRLFEEIGPAELARRLGISESNVFKRRRVLERKHRRPIIGPAEERNRSEPITAIPGRLHTNVEDGVVLVGGDLHAWPGEPSTAFRAFLKFCRDLRPKVVVLNGDLIDGSTVSRHPPIGWDKLPTLAEELEAASELLHQVTLAVPRSTELYWPLGNHDQRLETRIATVAPELAKMKGTHLRDHFDSRFQPCWSVWVNGEVVIKHRPPKGGVHSTYNSTLHAGLTTVCNHLHSLRVTPQTDYVSTRFGVDTGMLADPYGPQFRYLEDASRPWRSGFAVLTFRDGRLMWPELLHVIEPGLCEFRGELLEV
jgi:hypothetical protein